MSWLSLVSSVRHIAGLVWVRLTFLICKTFPYTIIMFQVAQAYLSLSNVIIHEPITHYVNKIPCFTPKTVTDQKIE